MLDTDELDGRWREGMRVLAARIERDVPPGAADRVAARVRERARRRVRRVAASAAALAAIVAFVVVLTLGGNSSTRVHTVTGRSPRLVSQHTVPPSQTLRISALSTLKLVAQVGEESDRVTITDDTVRLRDPGTYVFIMDGTAGHSLGFEELPGDDRILTGADPPRYLTVALPRGRFTIDCNIAGHAAAGMLLHVVVG